MRRRFRRAVGKNNVMQRLLVHVDIRSCRRSELQLNPQDVTVRLAYVLDGVDGGLAPREGARRPMMHLRLTAISRHPGIPVCEVDAQTMGVAMARLRLPDRHVHIQDSNELVLERQLVRSSSNPNGIQRIWRLRRHNPCDAGCRRS